MTLERRGRLTSIGLTFANPNIFTNSGIIVAHYLRRITERFDLGAEYLYQTDPKIPGNKFEYNNISPLILKNFFFNL